MKKVLGINRYTGIDTRSSIGTPDHPAVNKKEAPSIAELHSIFQSDGVPLAIRAARKAIDEAKIDTRFITHIVATTCTDSANPGFDHFVAKGLGITHGVEKVLLGTGQTERLDVAAFTDAVQGMTGFPVDVMTERQLAGAHFAHVLDEAVPL